MVARSVSRSGLESELVQPEDWILLKGSRTIALEKVVRYIGEMVFEGEQ